MRVLVLNSKPVGADELRDALGEDVGDAEIRVVAPALNESGLAFWVSDSDESIEEAAEVQRETVERLAAQDVTAAGDTGEGEPLMALQDALATFPADRIVIFVRAEDESRYREDDIAGEAERRFGKPVVQKIL